MARWTFRRRSAARNSLEDEVPGRLRSARKMNATKPVLRAKTDLWFLVMIKEIVDFEKELAGARN